MNIRELKEFLEIFPEETEIMVRTNNDDWAAPLTVKHIKLMTVVDDRVKSSQNNVLITAFLGQTK